MCKIHHAAIHHRCGIWAFWQDTSYWNFEQVLMSSVISSFHRFIYPRSIPPTRPLGTEACQRSKPTHRSVSWVYSCISFEVQPWLVLTRSSINVAFWGMGDGRPSSHSTCSRYEGDEALVMENCISSKSCHEIIGNGFLGTLRIFLSFIILLFKIHHTAIHPNCGIARFGKVLHIQICNKCQCLRSYLVESTLTHQN